MPELAVGLGVIALLVALNGLFVLAEFAVVAVAPAAMEHRAAQGSRLAGLVHRVLDHPRRLDHYIATAQIGITVASLGLGMYGELVLAERIAGGLESLGSTRWVAAHSMASVIAVVILTFLHIVFGEMIPKSLALQYAEPAALAVTPPMLALRFLLYPAVVVLNGTGNLLLRAVGVRRETSRDRLHTPEELALVVEESEAGGVLKADAGRLLRELFEFGDLTLGEVMVPRVRVAGLRAGAAPDDVRRVLYDAPHTRYPVYAGDLDHIIGAVHVKALARRLRAGEPLRDADVRPVPMLPESASLDALLATLRREGVPMAVVIDEHGGTAGIITLEDLFEEVVGEIDESPSPRSDMIEETAGRIRAKGTVRLDELGQRFDLDLASEEVDSVSGLILMELGRPPAVGDVVERGRVRLEVTVVRGLGVQEAVATLLPPRDDGA